MLDGQFIAGQRITHERIAIVTGSPKKLVIVNRHDDLPGDRISSQFHIFKSGQLFKIIVIDQAMPISYASDGGQLGSASLVPRCSLPMMDESAIFTNRAMPRDIIGARFKRRQDCPRP